MYKSFIRLPIACIACVFLYTVLYAEEDGGNLHIGALDINPVVSVEQKYDDNVFLEPDGFENDDWITTIGLGVGLDLPLSAERSEDFVLGLDYEIKFLEYWDLSDQDRIDHFLKAWADFIFANDWSLKIRDRFEKTADPPNSELTALEERWRNIIEATLGYLRERIGFDIGYRRIRDEYDTFIGLDKDTDEIILLGLYQITGKTAVFADYKYGWIDYDTNVTNSDSTYQEFGVGINGDIFRKLNGIFKVGYKSTDYEEEDKEDFNGITLFANLIYLLTERTTLNFFAERGINESTYSTNSYFEYDKIGLNLEHLLRERLFLVAGISWQENKYPDVTTEAEGSAKRHDEIWKGEIGVRYEMKDWIFFEARYIYKDRDSIFSTFDYTDNQYIGKVTVIF